MDYQQASQFMPTIAGYVKAWSENVVQLTVKGSGHFVPMDRPAQTLHMLVNFLRNNYNYSTPIFDVDTTPQPTISTPVSPPPNCTRKACGIRACGPSHCTAAYMAQWWTRIKPLGSPLFLENGPFSIGKDGITVTSNPHPWNKFANVLYLESPVGVGYSHSTDGVLPQYSDELVRKTMQFWWISSVSIRNTVLDPFIPLTGNNYDSSDPYMGYYCYMSDALSNYLNLDSVRSALNIPAAASKWIADGGIIAVYNQTNPSAAPSFDYIINSPYYNASNFTILLCSRDVDTICNWMGAEWYTTEYFAGNLGLPLPTREPWIYQTDPDNYPTLGGFARKYAKDIDVLTVKGSRHFVPLDRPMQALQMIYNWINRADYSTPLNITQPTTTPIPTTTTTPITTQSTASAVTVDESTPKPHSVGTPKAGDTTAATSSGTSPANILTSVQSAPPITEYTVTPTTSGLSNLSMLQGLMLYIALRILA
ncbi:unnamed protein product [Cylicocyclus nassatus]|uniref:Serine carboxypeptidase n=1 Tax=Cylicocyclus nassatus TaxID=53992 RepID=A0AA36HCQ8_CYLNA|nr:unnamed protein product [Cylicocyclus nassatus]